MLGESLGALLEHRLRTALVLAACAASVAVVTVMVGVSNATERRILRRVTAMGSDLVQVMAAPAPRVAGRQQQVPIMTNLRAQDATTLMLDLPGVQAAAAVMRTMPAHALGRNTTAAVMGTTTLGLTIRDIRLSSGRPWDDEEERELRRVALVGPTVAQILFGEGDPVGQVIRIGNVPFDVIGVDSRRGTDVGGTDLDNSILVPLTTAMRRVLRIPYVHAIAVKRAGSDLFQLEAEVRVVLDKRHRVRAGSPPPYVIQNQAVLLRTERGATRGFDRLTRSLGVLTALSGAAGILAVMLLAERERRREVGLRRAIGARRSDVAWQFVVESALLATLGGIAGVLVGGTAIGVSSLAGAWDAEFPLRASVLAIGGALLVGGLAGTYPAVRAARVDPVRSLSAE